MPSNAGAFPVDSTLKSTSRPPQVIKTLNHSPDVHTVWGYGMVGTGRTHQEARADLFEKIKTAGQA